MMIKRDRLFAACLGFLRVSATPQLGKTPDPPVTSLTMQVPFRDNILSETGPSSMKSAADTRFCGKKKTASGSAREEAERCHLVRLRWISFRHARIFNENFDQNASKSL
jgi:hypothetical protein